MTYTEADLKPIPQYEETGIPLLRKVWDAIKSDMSAWNQGDWIHGQDLDEPVVEYIKKHQAPPWNCGTTYCVAGHVALAKGAKIPIGRGPVARALEDNFLNSPAIRTPDGDLESVGGYAQNVLGLTPSQGSMLFHGDNTVAIIDALVQALELDPGADLFEVRRANFSF